MTKTLLAEVEKYCTKLLLKGRCAQLPFHNIEHTKEVVSNVKVIANYLQLTKEETEPIIIAAWFHDTGFSKKYEGHEDIGKSLALAYLKKAGYPSDKTDTVLSCIEATKMPQHPTDGYTEVLCDADVFHIGTPNFFYKKLLLRREWNVKGIMHVTDVEWHRLNRKFLHDHHFKTKYGKEVLEPGKLENEQKVDYILSFCG